MMYDEKYLNSIFPHGLPYNRAFIICLNIELFEKSSENNQQL